MNTKVTRLLTLSYQFDTSLTAAAVNVYVNVKVKRQTTHRESMNG